VDRRSANNVVQSLEPLALLGNEQFGVTDDVDEQDVSDLKLDLLVNLSGHINALTERMRMTDNLDATLDSREQSWPSGNDQIVLP
jgi:hypothetical protein